MSEGVKPVGRLRRIAPLLIMITIFAAPYFFASTIYESGNFFSFGKASNKGALISPVRKIETIEMVRLDGSLMNSDELLGKWTLVTVGSSECGMVCLDNLYKLRQVRLAVGKERSRVNRLYLLMGDDESRQKFTKNLDGFAGMEVVEGDASVASALKLDPTPWNGGIEGGIYLIDPLGNYMMAFKPEMKTEDILKDLQHLLKLSRIG